MKTKLIPTIGKAILCSAFIVALFAAPPTAVRGSDRVQAAKIEAAASTALSVTDADDQALAAQKVNSIQSAPVVRPPARPAAAVQPRKPGPTSPNGTPVVVTATAGTVGPTVYANVGAAFAAINAGTHQGDITVSITADSPEGATPATLNSSGAGSALYTSVLLRPTVDGVTISGNPASGFGVIQLNGADNVTIDGDNPNSGGTNRNLTISNTAVATVIANSAVRIATSTAVTSADNDTIKNCNLLGNVTGGNLSTITSTTGSSNSSFGIYCGGNGGATATGAPTAITSVTANTAPTGTTINNLLIDNNTVNQCARGIVFNGAVATVSNGVTISNNVIGDQGTPSPATPPYTSPSTTVYTKGIWVAGTASLTVNANTLKNIMSYVATTITSVETASPVTAVVVTNNSSTNIVENGATSAVKAILIASATGSYSVASNTITNVQAISSSSGTDAIEATAGPSNGTIEKNKVQTVYNRSTGTFGCYGINVTAGSGINIRNNFVADLNMDMTGGAAFSTTFGVFGIRVAGGTNHKIYHNSVNMFGTMFGTPTTSLLSAALGVVATTQTGMDIRNNILANNLNGGTTSVAHVSIYLPSGGTAAMNLTDNNNDYFFGADAARQGAGQAGTTAGTNFFTTLAALKTYTMTLSGAGTNDNASLAVDPQYLSNTDLHIAVASPMVDMGATVGVNTDIDGQNRVPPPDIGADEPSGITPPANDIAATAFVNPTNGSTISQVTVVTPQASFTNVGTATQTNVGVQFTITGPDGYNYVDNKVIATIASNQTVTVTFAMAPAFTSPGVYSMTAAVTTPDANMANDTIMGSFTVLAPIAGGSYNVPGDYPSLTNNGGIFAALNAAGATGNIVINITADLTAETGANALNELPGGFSVLIKPSLLPGAGETPASARTISGVSTGGGLIKINGADNVTIDGSDVGGTNRALTITNGNAGSTVIWIASASASNGANNTTIKNCNISGNTGVVAVAGILAGSGTTLGNDAEAANNNIVVVNNNIFRVQNSCYLRGTTAGTDTGWLVTGNTFGSTVAADKNIFRGMLVGNCQGFTVSNNLIQGILSQATSTAKMTGIQTALVISGGTIEKNVIRDIKQINTGTYGAAGIDLTGGNNIVVRNNFVSDINHDMTGGIAFSLTFGCFGIEIEAGIGHQIYGNSVNLFGLQTGTANSSLLTAAFAIGLTTDTGCDVRDNIFANNITGGTTSVAHVAVYLPSGGTSAMNLTENNNSYYWGTDAARQGAGQAGTTAGTNFFVTLAQLKAYSMTLSPAGTNDNASLGSTGPVPFLSSNNLHLVCGASELDAGVPLPGLTDDIDMQTRDMFPDMGADEQFAPTATSIVSRVMQGGAGTFDVALPGIEPRNTGGNYHIVYTFASPVTFASAQVVSGTGTVMTASGSGTNTITVDLTGVVDVQCLALNLVCATDGTNTGDVVAQMTVLIGDSNGNGAVNSSDASQIKSRIGQTVDSTNFRSDVTANGTINAGDVSIAKSKIGNGPVACKPLGKCYSTLTCLGTNVTTDCVDCLVTMMAGSWKDGAGVCHTTCPP